MGCKKCAESLQENGKRQCTCGLKNFQVKVDHGKDLTNDTNYSELESIRKGNIPNYKYAAPLIRKRHSFVIKPSFSLEKDKLFDVSAKIQFAKNESEKDPLSSELLSMLEQFPQPLVANEAFSSSASRAATFGFLDGIDPLLVLNKTKMPNSAITRRPAPSVKDLKNISEVSDFAAFLINPLFKSLASSMETSKTLIPRDADIKKRKLPSSLQAKTYFEFTKSSPSAIYVDLDSLAQELKAKPIKDTIHTISLHISHLINPFTGKPLGKKFLEKLLFAPKRRASPGTVRKSEMTDRQLALLEGVQQLLEIGLATSDNVEIDKAENQILREVRI